MAEARVLIVDDEPEYLETMAERMVARGFNVDTAANGLEALDKVEGGLFDVIVLDMMMPGMDGLETLKRIHKSHPDMQVILLTGYATVEKGVEAIKMGAMDFLEKPAEIDKLTEKVKAAHNKRLLLVDKKQEAEVEEFLRKYGV